MLVSLLAEEQRQRCTRGRLCTVEAEPGVMSRQAKKCQVLLKPPDAGNGKEGASPGDLGGSVSLQLLILDFQPLEHSGFCKPPSLWYFVLADLGTNRDPMLGNPRQSD